MPSLAAMFAWYKSWFRTSGTLEFDAYALHIAAAFGFFFAFALLGMSVFFVGVSLLVAFGASGVLAWLPIMIYMPIGLLAVGSWYGIIITSTIRFVRHLVATFAS
jgi:hypothetical protein